MFHIAILPQRYDPRKPEFSRFAFRCQTLCQCIRAALQVAAHKIAKQTRMKLHNAIEKCALENPKRIFHLAGVEGIEPSAYGFGDRR
ncbi:MAG: hypothetical protein LUC06_05495, partial [Oscillospiraceae bacterium]|nr:hypothetical protein [Oscillospiraceae bacterium]